MLSHVAWHLGCLCLTNLTIDEAKFCCCCKCFAMFEEWHLALHCTTS